MTSPNPYQPLDPQPVPDPVTPHASPSDPAGYAGVTPHGQGPAPYNIQDPGAFTDLSGVAAAAQALTGGDEGAPTGAGFGDVNSPRQQAAAVMMNSPAGFGGDGYDIQIGFSGGGGGDWPADVEPGVLETPVQGQAGMYPANTGTD